MDIWTSCYISWSIYNSSPFFSPLGMSTMKENKEKEVIGEESRPETQSQTRPLARDKKWSLSKNLDLGNLPNRRGKKARHGSSQIVKPNLPVSQPSVKIYDVDSSTPIETTLSKTPPPKMTMHPHPNFLNGSLQILLKMKTWLGNVFRKLFQMRT